MEINSFQTSFNEQLGSKIMFNLGDTVALNSSPAVPMTIEEIDNGMISTAWLDYELKRQIGTFEATSMHHYAEAIGAHLVMKKPNSPR